MSSIYCPFSWRTSLVLIVLVDMLNVCLSSAENFSVELVPSPRLATISCCGFRFGALEVSMSTLTSGETYISGTFQLSAFIIVQELSSLHGKAMSADKPLDGVLVVLMTQEKESVARALIKKCNQRRDHTVDDTYSEGLYLLARQPVQLHLECRHS